MLASLAIAGTLATGLMPVQASVIRPGDSGSDVRVLQTRLRQLMYDPGTPDGHYSESTRYAVWAFQKVNRLKTTGVVNRATWRALAHPRAPRLQQNGRPADRVEISIRRQLLVAYENKRIVLITHISSGTAGTPTPAGEFRVIRRINGWRHSRLGWMYRPLYFHSGFAMHGSASVPLHPASHGCVRIPMHTADRLPRVVADGTRVYVR